MNWLPNKGSHNQNIRRKNYIDRLILNSTFQVTKLMICLVGAGMFLSGDANHLKLKSLARDSPEKLFNQINHLATDISVKILGQDFLGSGFIIQHTEQKYTVITNQHVLRAGEAPYLIETADGKNYLAEVVSEITEGDYNYDLAILEFNAEEVYATAKIGTSLNLEVGQPVFAVGFPYNQAGISRTPAIFKQSDHQSHELTIKHGRIAIILNQGLEEGYQIGYTNDVKKGMSGGALLNSQGEVVGVASSILTVSGGFQGIGMAVTSNTVKSLLSFEDRPWIGIEGNFLSSDQLATLFNLNLEGGLLVQKVAQSSPADKAGIRGGFIPANIAGNSVLFGGDIILKLGKQETCHVECIQGSVKDMLAHQEKIEVVYLREGKEFTVTVDASEVRKNFLTLK